MATYYDNDLIDQEQIVWMEKETHRDSLLLKVVAEGHLYRDTQVLLDMDVYIDLGDRNDHS